MQGINLLLLLLSAFPPATRGEGGSNEQHIDDFQLRDARGGMYQLSDWHGKKLIVVAFLSVDCPLSRLYGPRLAELDRGFGPRGVGFVAIDANQHDAPSDLLRYLRDHPLPFPFLKDVGNTVADQFGAKRNPEVFVLDERRIVRYRGRIDDQYLPGVQRSSPGRCDLAIALEELLAGRRVSQPRCPASGCRISRPSKPPAHGAITYYRDTAPILQKHCQRCHQPGEIAPFSSLSYTDAAGWAATIREVVLALAIHGGLHNSVDNPLNPNPDAEVREGPQSWDEMFRGYFDVVLADQHLTRPQPLFLQAWQAVRTCLPPGVAPLLAALGCVYLARRRLALLLQVDEQ